MIEKMMRYKYGDPAGQVEKVHIAAINALLDFRTHILHSVLRVSSDTYYGCYCRTSRTARLYHGFSTGFPWGILTVTEYNNHPFPILYYMKRIPTVVVGPYATDIGTDQFMAGHTIQVQSILF